MNLNIRIKGGATVRITDAEEIVFEAPDSVYKKGTLILRRSLGEDDVPWFEGEALLPDVENLTLTWRKVGIVPFK